MNEEQSYRIPPAVRRAEGHGSIPDASASWMNGVSVVGSEVEFG